MELYQLRTFLTVSEIGSISGAGRKLGLTPSSVSAHIKALETSWEVDLFVRTSQGVEITEKGRILATYARETLSAADELSRQVIALKETLIGTVRIGVSVGEGVFKLSKMIDDVHRTYPDVTIDVVSGETASIMTYVQQETIDVGIVFGHEISSTLMSHHLTEVDLVLAVSSKIADTVTLNWESLAQQVWIHTGDNCPFQPLIDNLCRQHDIHPQQFLRINNERTRRDLVIAGMGVSLLEATEATHPAIRSMDGVRLTCPVSLVHATHRQFDPMIQAMASLIVQVV